MDPSATFHQLVLMALSASGSGTHVPSSLGENHKKQRAPSSLNAGCAFILYFDYYDVDYNFLIYFTMFVYTVFIQILN